MKPDGRAVVQFIQVGLPGNDKCKVVPLINSYGSFEVIRGSRFVVRASEVKIFRDAGSIAQAKIKSKSAFDDPTVGRNQE